MSSSLVLSLLVYLVSHICVPYQKVPDIYSFTTFHIVAWTQVVAQLCCECCQLGLSWSRQPTAGGVALKGKPRALSSPLSHSAPAITLIPHQQVVQVQIQVQVQVQVQGFEGKASRPLLPPPALSNRPLPLIPCEAINRWSRSKSRSRYKELLCKGKHCALSSPPALSNRPCHCIDSPSTGGPSPDPGSGPGPGPGSCKGKPCTLLSQALSNQ